MLVMLKTMTVMVMMMSGLPSLASLKVMYVPMLRSILYGYLDTEQRKGVLALLRTSNYYY